MNYFKHLFKKETEKEMISPERNARELLRENLKTIPVDVFYLDDPANNLTSEERKMYLKHFYELQIDKKLTERLKFLINKQANKTLGSSQGKEFDLAGAMTINGLALAKDEIERLSNMYIKEFGAKKTEFNVMSL